MPRSVDIYADARLNTAKAERQLRRFIKRAEAKKINLSMNERKFTQPLGRITGAANEFTKSLQASNARVLAFGASAGILYGVASAMRFMSDKTIEVEHHLAQVNVILNATSKNLKKFGDRLFKIAGDTGQSFEEVAKAATEFSRQGLGFEQTLKRTSSAMILMRLSGLGAKEAVESLTAAVNSFQKESINHVAIVNKMAKVDAAFAVSTSDLAQAIRRVGSTAEDAGVGIDKLFAAVTSLQQTTARGGAVIGNSLKTIFTRVKRTAVIEQMRSLGIATKDATGQMRPAMAVLSDFAKVFDDLSASEKAHTAELMGGVFQMNMLRGLLKDLKKDTSIYTQALKMSTEATDEAIERNAELNKTLKALLNESLQQLTKVGVAIGQMTLEPFFRTLMTEFNKMTSGKGLFAGLAHGVAGAIGDGLNMIGAKDSKHTGEEMGDKIGKGMLEGIGRFIQGPGVMLFTAVLYRLTLTFTKFLAQSGKDFLNLNSQSKNQLQLQEQIAGVLSTHPTLLKKIESGNLTVKQAEVQVLQILRQQRQERERMAYLAGGVAGRVMGPRGRGGGSGSMFVHKDQTAGTASLRSVRGRAQGHVPNFATPTPKERMGEVMAAREGGYKISPSDVVKKKFPGMNQALVFNRLENLDMLAYGKPLISPPGGTLAARGHVNEVNRKLGPQFNPYAGDGFIPNFFPRPNLKTAAGRRQAKGRGKVDFRTVPKTLVTEMQKHTGPFEVQYMSRGGYGKKAEIKTTTGVHFRESGYKGTGKGFPGGGSPSKDHKMLMMMTEKGPRGIPMEGIRAWRPSGQRNWNRREPGAAGGFVPNFAVSTAGMEAQRRYASAMGIHHTAGRGGVYAATGGAASLDKLMKEFIKEAQMKNWVNVGRTGKSALAAADRAATTGLITRAQADAFAKQIDLVKKNKGALTGTAAARLKSKEKTAAKRKAGAIKTDYWMLSSEMGMSPHISAPHGHAGLMWTNKVAGWKKQGAGDTGFQSILEKELSPAFRNIYTKMFSGLGIGDKPPKSLKSLDKYAPVESIAGSLFDGFIKHAITRSPKTANDVSKHVMDIQNMKNASLEKLFGLKGVRAGSKGDLKLKAEGAGPGFAGQMLDDLVIQYSGGGIAGIKNRITKHPYGTDKDLQNALSLASGKRIPEYRKKGKGKADGYVPNFAVMRRVPMTAPRTGNPFQKYTKKEIADAFRYGKPGNQGSEGGLRWKKGHKLDAQRRSELLAYGEMQGRGWMGVVKNVGMKAMEMFGAGGYVPNFSAEGDAFKREKKASGLPMSQIYSTFVGGQKVVGNLRDEPTRGALIKNIKNHPYPALAGSEFAAGGFVPSFASLSSRAPHPLGGPMGGAGTYAALTYGAMQHSAIQRRGVRTVGPRGGVSFPKHAEGPALKTIQQLSAHLTAMGKAGTGASMHTKELSRALRLHVKQFRESHLSLETALRSASRAALNFKEPIGVLQAQITAAGKSAGVADKHLASLQNRIWAAGQVAQQKAATWAKGGGTPYGPMMSGGRGQVGRALAAAPGQWMGATTTSAAYTAATGQKATAANMARAGTVGLHSRIAASLPAPVLTDSVKPAALRMINTHLQKMEQSLRRGGVLTHSMVDSLNVQMNKHKVMEGDQQAIIKYMDQRQTHYQAIVTEEKKKIALVRQENEAIKKQIAARTFTPINPLAPATGKGGAASVFGTKGGGLVGAVGRSVAGMDKKVGKAKAQKRIQKAMAAQGMGLQAFTTVQGAYGGGKMTHAQLGRAYGGVIGAGQGGMIAGKPMMLQGHLISSEASKTAKHHALSNTQLTKINAEYGKIHAAMARGAPLTMEMQFAFQRILHKLGIEERTQTQIITAMQGQASAMQGIVAEETQQLALEKQQTLQEKKEKARQAKLDAVSKAELLAKEGIVANLRARMAAMQKGGAMAFFSGSGMGQLGTMAAGGGKAGDAAKTAMNNIKEQKSQARMGKMMMFSMMAPMITSSIAQFEKDKVKKAKWEGFGDVAMMSMMGSMFGGAGLVGGLAVGSVMAGNKVFRALIDNSEQLGNELELAKEKLTNFNDGVQKLVAATERYQGGLRDENIQAGELSMRKQLQMDAFAQIPEEFRPQIIGVQGDQERMQTTLEAIRRNTADLVKLSELRAYQEKLTNESRTLGQTLGGGGGGEGWIKALTGSGSMESFIAKEVAITVGLGLLTYFTGGAAGGAFLAQGARVLNWGSKAKKASKAVKAAKAGGTYSQRMARGIGPAGIGKRLMLGAGIQVGGTMGGLWGDGKLPGVTKALWQDDKPALLEMARAAQTQVFDDTDRGKMALIKIGDMYKDILDMPVFFAEKSEQEIQAALTKLQAIDPNDINKFVESLRKDFGLNEKAIIELEDFLKSRAAGQGLKDVPKLIQRLMDDMQKGLDVKKQLAIFNETIEKQKALGIRMRENARSYADAIRAVDIELTSAVSVMQQSVLRNNNLLGNVALSRRNKLLGTVKTRMKTNEPFMNTSQRAGFGAQVAVADSRNRYITELKKLAAKNQGSLLNLFSTKLDSINKSLVKEYESLEMKGEDAKEIRRKKQDISGQRDALSGAFTDVANIFARDRNAGAESIAGVLYRLVDDPAFKNQQALLQSLIAEVRIEGEKNVTKLTELIQSNQIQEQTLLMQRKLQQEQINLQKRLSFMGGAKAYEDNTSIASTLMEFSEGVMASQFAQGGRFGFDSNTIEEGRSAYKFLKMFKDQTQMDMSSVIRGKKKGMRGDDLWQGQMGVLVDKAVTGLSYRLEREASTIQSYMRDVMQMDMDKMQMTPEGTGDWRGIAREQIAADLEMGDIAGNIYQIREGIAQFNKLASLNEANFQDKNKEAFKQAMKEVALVEAIEGTTGEVSQFGGYNIGKLNDIISLLDTQNAIREIGEKLTVAARREKEMIGIEGGLKAGLPNLFKAMEEAQQVEKLTSGTAQGILDRIIKRPPGVDKAAWDAGFTDDKKDALIRQLEQLGQYNLQKEESRKAREEVRTGILGPSGRDVEYAKLKGDDLKKADLALAAEPAWKLVETNMAASESAVAAQRKLITDTIKSITAGVSKTRFKSQYNIDPTLGNKPNFPFPAAPKDYFEYQKFLNAKGGGKGYGNLLPGDNTLLDQAKAQGKKMGISINARSGRPEPTLTSDAEQAAYDKTPIGSKTKQMMTRFLENAKAKRAGTSRGQIDAAFSGDDKTMSYMLQMARAAHWKAMPTADKLGSKATKEGIALSKGMGFSVPDAATAALRGAPQFKGQFMPDWYQGFMKGKKISSLGALGHVTQLQKQFIQPRTTAKRGGEAVYPFKDTIGDFEGRLKKAIGPTGEIIDQAELEKLWDDMRMTFREAIRYEWEDATGKGSGAGGAWRSGLSESDFFKRILNSDSRDRPGGGGINQWMKGRNKAFQQHSRPALVAVANMLGLGSDRNQDQSMFKPFRDADQIGYKPSASNLITAGIDLDAVKDTELASLAAEGSARAFAREAEARHKEGEDALEESKKNLTEAIDERADLEKKLTIARSKDETRRRQKLLKGVDPETGLKLSDTRNKLAEYQSPYALRGKIRHGVGRSPLGYNKEAIQNAQIFGKQLQLGKEYLSKAGTGSQHLSEALSPIRTALSDVMDENFTLAHNDTARMTKVLELINTELQSQTETYNSLMTDLKNAITDGEPGHAEIIGADINTLMNESITPLKSLSVSIQALLRLQNTTQKDWGSLMGPQMAMASALLRPGQTAKDRGNTLDRMEAARINELRKQHEYDAGTAAADDKIIKKKAEAAESYKDAEAIAASAQIEDAQAKHGLFLANEARREWLADPKNIINPIVQPGAPGGQEPDIDAIDPFAVPRPEGRGGPHTSPSRREALVAGANLRRQIAKDAVDKAVTDAEAVAEEAKAKKAEADSAKQEAATRQAEAEKLKVSGKAGDFQATLANDKILQGLAEVRSFSEGPDYKKRVVKWQDEQANDSARIAMKDLDGAYETLSLSTRTFAEDLIAIGKKITDEKIKMKEYGMDDWIRGIREEMTYTTNNLHADLDALGRGGINRLRTGFADVFYEALDGTKSLREGFKDLFDEIGNMITKSLIQMAVNRFIFAPAGINTGATGGAVVGGKIRKYARGGQVTGGSGIYDDVPAMLNSGEFVIRKSSVNKYGTDFLDHLNRGRIAGLASGGDPQAGLRSRRATGRNYTSSTLRNATIYDDNEYPTLDGSGFEIDPRLSRRALWDDENPQNEFRMRKQAALYDYHKSVLDQEKAWEETLREWKASKKARMRKAWASAAISMTLGLGDKEAGPFYSGNIKQNYGYKLGKGIYEMPGNVLRGAWGAGKAGVGGVRRGGAAAWNWARGRENAEGGFKRDNIAALLTGGEYVVSREAVAKHGRSFFEKLNEGSLPQYEKGGYVGGQPSVQGPLGGNTQEIENNINITVNIDSEGQSSETGTLTNYEENRDQGNKMGAALKDVVVKTIIDQTRQGGVLASINKLRG